MDRWDFDGRDGRDRPGGRASWRPATRSRRWPTARASTRRAAWRRPTRAPRASPSWPSSTAARPTSLAVLDEVAAAGDVVEAPRDWLTDLGLDGDGPGRRRGRRARRLGGGRPRGGATAAAADAVASARGGARRRAGRRSWRSAPAAALGSSCSCAAWSSCGAPRSGVGAPVAAAAVGRPPAPEPRGPAGPYATLPPDGPPAGPPGGPPSGDEGADRS